MNNNTAATTPAIMAANAVIRLMLYYCEALAKL